MEFDTTFFPIYISIFLIGVGAVLYVNLKEKDVKKKKGSDEYSKFTFFDKMLYSKINN